MKRLLVGVAVLAGVFAFGIEANAGGRGYKGEGAHQSSPYYRGGPKVKGYVKRRGGYSYTYEDSINTYGDSNSLYGGTSAYSNPYLDRQTTSGPFDNGYFFSTPTGPQGGSSPYMH
ncbi:MAG: hypothetical protein KJ587_10820 [Alphaproteobacteria bacterium]|nr:hypothetical protein [Alphaproteobacteria bacterium]